MEVKAMMVEKLTRKEFDLWVRNDFCSFLQLCFHSLNPQTKFLPNWYLQVVAAKLEACRLGKYRRLIINLPPRHFKSTAASVSFVAWYLGHNPAGQIICVSYAQDFAEKLARDFRGDAERLLQTAVQNQALGAKAIGSGVRDDGSRVSYGHLGRRRFDRTRRRSDRYRRPVETCRCRI
jgi:hypothetical protein